ncbi:MAG: ribbon-helix-helix domain-containing protein [Janthinobacterium lividum]
MIEAVSAPIFDLVEVAASIESDQRRTYNLAQDAKSRTVNCCSRFVTKRHMIQRLSRNISLTPALDRYLLARAESGAYATVSEVVRVTIRLLQEREPSSSPSEPASSTGSQR